MREEVLNRLLWQQTSGAKFRVRDQADLVYSDCWFSAFEGVRIRACSAHL